MCGPDKSNSVKNMMNRCENCKYWEQNTLRSNNRWKCHKQSQMLGICNKAYGGENNNGQWVLAACRSEGIYGDLITDSRFYCILFEEKSDEKLPQACGEGDCA